MGPFCSIPQQPQSSVPPPWNTVWGLHTPITKASGHHTGGHIVELDDGGMNGGCKMLIALLVPLGPNGTQAVVGNHLLE
jgi:hypothetical protein